ncbi:SDR family oxidoreductase [Shewanella waksmanii]|uniref:SDR family oxidoreductase n=1 Tax=Shewanella waksmanii TaxID=213783 RepID=UPI003734E2C3
MPTWALITGGALRIGKSLCQQLHAHGYNVIVHYNNNGDAAHRLATSLNSIRPDSAATTQADLADPNDIQRLIEHVNAHYPDLAVLINNASVFYPNDMKQLAKQQIDDVLSVNLVAPITLASGLSQVIGQQQGAIVNLIDIHGDKPLAGHGLYSISKAGLKMATLTLAQELAPDVRVNGVSPGAILWPKEGSDEQISQVVNSIPLGKPGTVKDITDAVMFLVQAPYITGQVINVDGGRSAVGYQGAV